MNREILKNLIEEGHKLRETFTEECMSIRITTDRIGVSKWLTKSKRVLEEVEGSSSSVFKEFDNSIGHVGNLFDKKFDELIGMLEGVYETSPEENSLLY